MKRLLCANYSLMEGGGGGAFANGRGTGPTTHWEGVPGSLKTFWSDSSLNCGELVTPLLEP
jgi:hypothetical protein